jgi:2-phosphosulfolactate phosphatase
MPGTTSTRSITVHLLAEPVHPNELAGADVVLIDVLRASTTLTAAIAAGALQVMPCLEIAEARQLARQCSSRGPLLLGGERGGLPIAGFDLGNSPAEYVAERVAGRTLIFTTTNGTRAMMRCMGAGRVLIGCFANLSAVAAKLDGTNRIHLVCAGTDGEVSWEDSLLAGAMVERLGGGTCQLNDAALLVMQSWQQVGGFNLSAAELAAVLQRGRGGQNLLAIQRLADIEWAAQIDGLDVVPQLDLVDWVIRRTDALP